MAYQINVENTGHACDVGRNDESHYVDCEVCGIIDGTVICSDCGAIVCPLHETALPVVDIYVAIEHYQCQKDGWIEYTDCEACGKPAGVIECHNCYAAICECVGGLGIFLACEDCGYVACGECRTVDIGGGQ